MAYIRFTSLVQFLSLFLLATAVPTLESRSSKTRQFTVTLTNGPADVVGATNPRDVILTNGTTPGPTLYMNQGDSVEFLVHNQLPFDTTIHFHGITQQGTPWSDGVPGLSQKPIQPGSSYLYKWTATDFGTYFYHAHRRGQIMDGLYGAIMIAPNNTVSRPYTWISNDTTDIANLQKAEDNATPIFLADFSQYNSSEMFAIQEAANIDYTCVDSIIINGKGSVYCQSQDEINAQTPPTLGPILATHNPSTLTLKGCLPPDIGATEGNYTFNTAAIPPNAFDVCTPSSGPMYEITVDPAGGWASLNFIASGGFSTLEVSIDSHPMYIYQVEGVYIQPQVVGNLLIHNGQRYSAMIKLDQEVGQYAIRVANQALNQVISGFAVLTYKGATAPASDATAYINYAGVNTSATVVPFLDAQIVPWAPNVPPQTADATHFFNITKLPAGSYQWQLATDGDQYNMTEENHTPLLFNKDQPAASDSSLYIQTKMGDVVDLIVQVAGPLAQPHPMHKHSNKAWVIGSGLGNFGYADVATAVAAEPNSFNLVNPPYRDGFTTVPAEGNSSWLAIRYTVENPGAWLFHCHIQTHLSGGMAVALLDGVDQWPVTPEAYLTGNGFSSKKSKRAVDFFGLW